MSPVRIVPAVGSISRISVRTSVDFPEPERPMTTNTSPGQTEKETSRTAATQPVFVCSSPRGRSASGVPTTRSAWGPNTFQTPSTRISGSPLRSMRGPLDLAGAERHAPYPRSGAMTTACRLGCKQIYQSRQRTRKGWYRGERNDEWAAELGPRGGGGSGDRRQLPRLPPRQSGLDRPRPDRQGAAPQPGRL